MRRLVEKAGLIRSMAVNILLLAIVLGVGIILIRELSRRSVVVEPLGVPRELAEKGYSGEVLARRLIDELSVIRTKATTSKEDITPEVLPDRPLPDISIPGAAVSLRSVVQYVAMLLGKPPMRLRGEVVLESDGLRLRLRAPDSEDFEDFQAGPEEGIDTLLQLGARGLMKRFDPYRLASYLKDRDTGQSLRLIAYTLASKPATDDPWAYNLWGLILQDQGEYDEALKRFGLAIEADSDFVLAYSNAGKTLALKGRYAEARSKHREASRVAPDEPYVYTSWGNSLKLEGRFDEAREKYAKAASLDPENAYAQNEFARFLSKIGSSRAAAERFRTVVRLIPDSPVANNNLGNELRNLGRRAEAALFLKRSIELDRDYGSAYYNFGLLQISLDRPARALACYDKALTGRLTAESRSIVKRDRSKLLGDHNGRLEPHPEGCLSSGDMGTREPGP